MPLYVHSFPRPRQGDADRLVLERPLGAVRTTVVGLAAAGIGLGVAAGSVDPQWRFTLGIGCAIASLTAAALTFATRTDRIVFDRAARTVTLASGAVVPFADVRQLVVMTEKEDGEFAYTLGLDTGSGLQQLSRVWCWNEALVLEAAAAIVAAFPDLPFSPDARRTG